jgi:peptidoglycan/LPS O-acetylase OafA/YrhL
LKETQEYTRFQGVDGLRAFAVIAVIAAHSHVPWLHGGGVGVDVFFGISGFLITFLLIRESARWGRIDLRKFWLRRLLRLMPALIVLVICVNAAVIALSFIQPGTYQRTTVEATPSVLFYYSNWMIVATDSAFLGWFGPLWSLSVEEQFYLVWPVIVILAMQARRPLLLLAVIASAVSIVAMLARFIAFDGSNVYRTFGTDFRVDMLLSGVLLAIAMQAGQRKLIRGATQFLVLPAIVFLIVISVIVPEFGSADSAGATRMYYTVGLPLVALANISIVGFLITHQGSVLVRWLSWRPIEYTGRVSYGMYLWHYPIIMIVAGATSLDPTLVFVISLVLTYLAAGVSWRLIEKPLQDRFHGRLRPTQKSTLGQAERELS